MYKQQIFKINQATLKHSFILENLSDQTFSSLMLNFILEVFFKLMQIFAHPRLNFLFLFRSEFIFPVSYFAWKRKIILDIRFVKLGLLDCKTRDNVKSINQLRFYVTFLKKRSVLCQVLVPVASASGLYWRN